MESHTDLTSWIWFGNTFKKSDRRSQEGKNHSRQSINFLRVLSTEIELHFELLLVICSRKYPLLGPKIAKKFAYYSPSTFWEFLALKSRWNALHQPNQPWHSFRSKELQHKKPLTVLWGDRCAHTGLISCKSFQITTLKACITLKIQSLRL